MKEYFERQQKIKQEMLSNLEHDYARHKEIKKKLDSIGDDVFTRLGEAIKDKALSPYKSAMAYGKLIDGVYKLQDMSLKIYDRINGVVMGGDEEDLSLEEVVEVDVKEIEFSANLRRDAEKLVLMLVKDDNKKPHPDDLQKKREAS